MTLRPVVSRRGREPSELELRYLRLMRRLTNDAAEYKEHLEDQVLAMLDSGCSTRSIATEVGVSGKTIHHWAENARQRRGEQR